MLGQNKSTFFQAMLRLSDIRSMIGTFVPLLISWQIYFSYRQAAKLISNLLQCDRSIFPIVGIQSARSTEQITSSRPDFFSAFSATNSSIRGLRINGFLNTSRRYNSSAKKHFNHRYKRDWLKDTESLKRRPDAYLMSPFLLALIESSCLMDPAKVSAPCQIWSWSRSFFIKYESKTARHPLLYRS